MLHKVGRYLKLPTFNNYHMKRKIKLSKNEQVLELAKKSGILRPKDLETHGIPREYLIRLYRKGLLNRVGRGLYTSPHANMGEHHSIAEVCKRVPHAVVCLLSALRFHGLTTQAPFEVWIAIDNKARRPKQANLFLRVVRFSGDAFLKGIEEHSIEGVRVRVFDPAKTVADCFKYRNKIGLDVAIEALRECWRNRRCTMDQLWYYAKICRVTNVIRPYLESVT
jgi:predicted transcriptional regulator of viral defense system